MARQGRERFEKRQRERDKQRKAREKRERRQEKRDADADPEAEAGPTEDELLEQVRVLNEQRAAKAIDEETFAERQAELFEQLGIE